MSKLEKIKLTEIASKLGQTSLHMIGRLSFEGRSLSIFNEVLKVQNYNCTFFSSMTESPAAEKNRSVVSAGEGNICAINTRNSLETFVQMKSKLDEIIENAEFEKLLVDLTSFRREELLMLLQMLNKQKKFSLDNVILLYNSASQMGDWLSKDPYQVTSIIGYAGEVDPERPTVLVVLLGFENDRARFIIDSYEPKKLVICISTESGAINDDFYARNKALRDDFINLYALAESGLDFVSDDPASIYRSLQAVVNDYPNSNIVIAPLHTKIASLGVAKFALENPSVQLCYAKVGLYNTSNFSQPSEEVYLATASSIFDQNY